MSRDNEEWTSSSTASPPRYSVSPDIWNDLPLLVELGPSNFTGKASTLSTLPFSHVTLSLAPKSPSVDRSPFMKLTPGNLPVADETVVPSLTLNTEQEKHTEIAKSLSFRRKYISNAFPVDDSGRGDEPRVRLEIIYMEETGDQDVCPVEKPDRRCVQFKTWI